MLARVATGTLVGVDAVRVDVEVDMALGLPYFNVVGLPDGAAKESKVRVISAIKNSDYELPQKRVTVNLAPADLRKDGAAFELPIALGVMAAARAFDPAVLEPYFFAGELSLDGFLKKCRGVLPLALAARAFGARGVVIPAANVAEAALVEGIEVIGVAHLKEAVEHVTGERPIPPWRPGAALPGPLPSTLSMDFAEVRGQDDVKEVLEVAAAGSHNVLMCGPPGAGKTMLARRLPGILPPMDFDEALEVTKIYSAMGLLREGQGLIRERPFRSPHHTISDAGLVGGGPHIRPGELSLAHRGVLFLDELPEFRKNVLEVLRQPIEESRIHLARANGSITYPCQVMLVAAMNPCPCGWFGVQGRSCTCFDHRVTEYRNRISGPLLDRIDINVQVAQVDPGKVVALSGREKPSSFFRARVEEARERQRHRFRDEPGVLCNAHIPPGKLARYCVATDRANRVLSSAIKQYGLSARAHDRILKLSRTRADLQGHRIIEAEDLLFALQMRVMDRRDWLKEQLNRNHPSGLHPHRVNVPFRQPAEDRRPLAEGSAEDPPGTGL